MELITCQHEWVKQCQLSYKCKPPVGYWFEDAHYPLSKKLGGASTVRLWYPDHIVQGVLQTLEYQHPCIFTRNVREPYILEEVYPEYLDLYWQAVRICKSYAGKKGAVAGIASEKYRSSAEYKESRVKSGKKAWENKTGAFSQLGTQKRLKKISAPVRVETVDGIIIFPSITAAAQYYGVDRRTIDRWMRRLPADRSAIISVLRASEETEESISTFL